MQVAALCILICSTQHNKTGSAEILQCMLTAHADLFEQKVPMIDQAVLSVRHAMYRPWYYKHIIALENVISR